MNDIDRTSTKSRAPQATGICGRFHKTILNEFYRIVFLKKIYSSIEEPQADLDAWLHVYSHECAHEGKMCCGQPAKETFEEGKRICREKTLAE